MSAFLTEPKANNHGLKCELCQYITMLTAAKCWLQNALAPIDFHSQDGGMILGLFIYVDSLNALQVFLHKLLMLAYFRHLKQSFLYLLLCQTSRVQLSLSMLIIMMLWLLPHRGCRCFCFTFILVT